MTALDCKNPRALEAALSGGLVTIGFEKKSNAKVSPGNECHLCKKVLWENPDPTILSLSHTERPYGYGDEWEPAGDGVAHLACNRFVHDKCFSFFGIWKGS